MIDQWGIEANPDKTRAILQMQSPTTIRDVQKLTVCIIALGIFMSRSVDKYLPFFKVLKRKRRSDGMKRQREPFRDLRNIWVSFHEWSA